MDHGTRSNRIAVTLRRVAGATLLAAALVLVGCSSDSDNNGAAATEDATAHDGTTTTGAPTEDEETTTTEVREADGAHGGDGCPAADEVSEAIGGSVQAAPDQVPVLFAPAVVAAADVACAYTADGVGLTPPLVAFVSSDDPTAEAAASEFLADEDEVVDVPGVGEEALGNGQGELVFRVGSTWSVVVAAAAPAPSSADHEAAVAVAHLIGG